MCVGAVWVECSIIKPNNDNQSIKSLFLMYKLVAQRWELAQIKKNLRATFDKMQILYPKISSISFLIY